MTRLAALLSLVPAAACTPSHPAAAPAASVPEAAQAEQDILALHRQWTEARIEGDVAFLEKFYGQELRLNVMDGGVVPRDVDISFFDREGKNDNEVIKPTLLEDVEMKVTTYGDAAVATGIENLKGTAMGNYGEMSLRFTNVLVWRDGRWQLVHHQSTPVQKQAPQ